ncbi:NADase-type glycan-binding domain-containing protein [Actinosynnema sp. NPDC004786]
MADPLASRVEAAIAEGPPDPEEPVAAAREPEDPAARPSLWARWRAWVRSRFGKDGAAPPAEPGPRATERPEAARVRTTAGSEAALAEGRSDVVLGPVLPARPEAKRPLPTTAAEVGVDGPPCPVCGTTNPPGRRFCRRCATPLQGAAPAPAEGRRRRVRRHGDTSRWLRRLAALLVVAALVVAGILFHPRGVELFEDLRDRLATPAPIAPVRTAATAEVPDHPAGAAVDGLSNRYWGAPAVGDAIEFGFDRPFRLLSVVVHTGASAQPEQFREQARPTALDLVVTVSGGGTRTIPVTLNDQPGPQRTDTGIGDVVAVRLVVKSAAGLGAGRHVALGEVEFFRRP